METRAYLKGTRLSPQKAGLVANAVRGKSVQNAMDFLMFDKQKGSAVIKKLLESAIANAENNEKADIDLLVIKSIIVNQGMRLKRMKPRARGRADRVLKPTCHIEIILTDQEK
ncbi:50S ribosomal protein L22 [Gammaproteobacteria bacterium]|jgi:large subunit ribosomal protein L22|nr:50S ribosomal protein L22 [Gammaproteobacteria bacterium]MDA9094491.1 50S ribosomal protein L22 [Gammaproteobacteria bacterium]MDB9996846.1 50S ribosomal protein L22 [Gammaproteobacteria bacterium]MDC1191246.1 50S ribosomal protein L22 [Gammaproteobacteria bacterium]|tara:strand:+ start:6365 stop:6703 length:339 start_codon:yes stop_codon:yes gene_type:complete